MCIVIVRSRSGPSGLRTKVGLVSHIIIIITYCIVTVTDIGIVYSYAVSYIVVM